MTRPRSEPSRTARATRYRLLAALSAWALASVAVLSVSDRAYFRPYFGDFHPFLAVTIASALGFTSLRYLDVHGWFEIIRAGETRRGVTLGAIVATILAADVVVADFFIVFPEDMNVPFPHALLFYPVMAWVVEACFHALPLALVLGMMRSFSVDPGGGEMTDGDGTGGTRSVGAGWPVVAALAFVSLLEPTFQVVLGFTDGTSTWAAAYVACQLLAFNFAQLYVFRRYDFVSMLSLRLVYYTYWHIVWGYVRLEVLF